MLLFYSVPLQRWSYAFTTASAIAVTITPSVTLEALDNFSISIDALTISLDDRHWAGGSSIFSGVSGGRVITFSGANKEASIITGEIDTSRCGSRIRLCARNLGLRMELLWVKRVDVDIPSSRHTLPNPRLKSGQTTFALNLFLSPRGEMHADLRIG